MDWINIVVYVLGWAVLLNTIWVTFLAVHKPKHFNQLIEQMTSSKYSSLRIHSTSIRAYFQIFIVMVGYCFIFYIVFRLAFSFIPGEWGGISEDGEFVAIRDTFAGIAALLMSFLILSAINHAGDRYTKELAAKKKINVVLQELESMRSKRLNEIYEMDILKKAERNTLLEASAEKQRYEIQVKKLRSLLPPEILEDLDRIEREQAEAGTKTFYS